MKITKLKNKDKLPERFTGIVEWENGTKYWYKEGKKHREDGPAVEWANGSKEWWFEGKYHRLDGPAREYVDGTKCWYKEGKLHRIDGPAVEYPNGNVYWYIDNECYNPAILWSFIENSSVFLGKKKSKYGFEWIKFFTEDGLKEFPIIPGMNLDKVEGYEKWTMTLLETE